MGAEGWDGASHPPFFGLASVLGGKLCSFKVCWWAEIVMWVWRWWSWLVQGQWRAFGFFVAISPWMRQSDRFLNGVIWLINIEAHKPVPKVPWSAESWALIWHIYLVSLSLLPPLCLRHMCHGDGTRTRFMLWILCEIFCSGCVAWRCCKRLRRVANRVSQRPCRNGLLIVDSWRGPRSKGPYRPVFHPVGVCVTATCSVA